MATGVILISLQKGSKANNLMRRQRSPEDIDTS